FASRLRGGPAHDDTGELQVPSCSGARRELAPAPPPAWAPAPGPAFGPLPLGLPRR
ncbi:hypothetical protein P7K49_027657, partial [Saguinus oedipus]